MPPSPRLVQNSHSWIRPLLVVVSLKGILFLAWYGLLEPIEFLEAVGELSQGVRGDQDNFAVTHLRGHGDLELRQLVLGELFNPLENSELLGVHLGGEVGKATVECFQLG